MEEEREREGQQHSDHEAAEGLLRDFAFIISQHAPPQLSFYFKSYPSPSPMDGPFSFAWVLSLGWAIRSDPSIHHLIDAILNFPEHFAPSIPTTRHPQCICFSPLAFPCMTLSAHVDCTENAQGCADRKHRTNTLADQWTETYRGHQ